MKRNFSLTMMIGILLATKAHAETASSSTTFQFYVGLSGGIEKMSGQRSESLDEENQTLGPPNRTKTIYSNNLEMKERNVVPSGMAGFLWKIPAVPFWVGPEVCVGRGNTTSSVSDVRLDPFGGGENRIYKTDFQRKLFYGALIRFAYQFYQEYLVYLSAGVDHSQFSIKRTLHHQATVPATSIQRTKNMNGTVFGLGVEKNFNQFIVGFDIKMIQYRKYNVVDDVRVAHGVDPAFLNFPVQPKIRMFSLRVAYRF